MADVGAAADGDAGDKDVAGVRLQGRGKGDSVIGELFKFVKFVSIFFFLKVILERIKRGGRQKDNTGESTLTRAERDRGLLPLGLLRRRVPRQRERADRVQRHQQDWVECHFI